ncbi:tRNA dihydrouridine(20/20a) synthase DusA [Moraxella bovis]|uniref:tRNA dihydrouridine(20/20a) synthase DusA n=1 Tax=Moraxella bovis TaxID=476 RepID=UPI000993AB81|nr:tRNA dihydrouridine(20/20a) synthase DusA [Moraxella bovis]OOR91445.1 tRNA dihydrouridine(20/20a) synthase DusA [Moraxella bovis]UZA20407.1 tRNA dihydrouridine(20/20a) synthase DusA [Moraxella bovis]UZA25488.1 tRNA dihydrouridine(20/20a) synthase DusA [Moraxella bovis]UZA29020.1 tRNA dihydrouridine(20/20a) synthase DusA [Moraxella bovis]UZA31759.1 tRNA dihydrouridine(20/20a) synthase DusA [Moraxella bovis]
MIDFKDNKRISLAPMIDWTTADFRYFARLFNRHIHLYTEMISTSAILKGDTEYILRYNDSEHPVALQLGGSNPNDMAQCVQIADKMGYDEFNINVGCPSDRVQHNKIGACLMAEPKLVADMVRAMKDSTDKPVTIKHRIGIDTFDSYEFMRDFVGTVAEAGCTHFIAHARIAWLNGLSPKENREIPPLRYDDIYRLKTEFPHLFIEINGGVDNFDDIKIHLTHVDGVMIGRAFYHNPMLMGACNELWGEPIPTHREILENLYLYLEKRAEQGANLATLTRHYLGLFQGLTGARKWRQDLSGKRNLTVDDIKQAGESVLSQNGL